MNFLKKLTKQFDLKPFSTFENKFVIIKFRNCQCRPKNNYQGSGRAGNLGGNRSPQPPCGRRQAQSRWARRPLCSDPWHSCCRRLEIDIFFLKNKNILKHKFQIWQTKIFSKNLIIWNFFKKTKRVVKIQILVNRFVRKQNYRDGKAARKDRRGRSPSCRVQGPWGLREERNDPNWYKSIFC